MKEMKVAIRYVVQDVDRHGNVRTYVRLPGKRKIRIRHEVGSGEFWRAYNAVLAGETPVAKPTPPERAKPGSLRALIEAYRVAPEFKNLDQRTRKVRAGLLETICQSTIADGSCRGDLPHVDMSGRHVRQIRDHFSIGGPEAANARLKALRRLFDWAVAADRAERNPARDVPYFPSNPNGFHTWTVEEVHQYWRRHKVGTKARLAVDLMLFGGLRKSDAVVVGRPHLRDWWLNFTEQKNRNRKPKHRSIPVLPQLRQSIEAAPSGHLTFLVTMFGQPFTTNGFGNWFRKRCNEAGLQQCSAHGLRKAGAVLAAENGATEKQLMAIFGWETSKEATRYTRQADKKRLAADAMPLISVPPMQDQWDNSKENDNDINDGNVPVVPRAGVQQK